MNNPGNGRRNWGAEGIDKIVINKWKGISVEQSLTEDWRKLLIVKSHCSSRRPVNTHTIIDLEIICQQLNTLYI